MIINFSKSGDGEIQILYMMLNSIKRGFIVIFVSHIYSGMNTIGTPFRGSVFSACDVTAWCSELKHWPRTREGSDAKVRKTLK